MMHTQADREERTERLRAVLPAGSTVRIREVYRKRGTSGVTWTRFRVTTDSGTNISRHVAAATNNDFHAGDQTVRGQFGGLSPERQLLAELGMALYGRSDAITVPVWS